MSELCSECGTPLTGKRPGPVLRSFVLAEAVYQEAQTGKKIIAGTFHNVISPKFPVVLPSAMVYMALTGAHGTPNFQIRLVDLRDDLVLMETPPLPAQVENPLATAEVILRINGFQFPHPGQYDLEAYCNGERMVGLRISVAQAEGPGT